MLFLKTNNSFSTSSQLLFVPCTRSFFDRSTRTYARAVQPHSVFSVRCIISARRTCLATGPSQIVLSILVLVSLQKRLPRFRKNQMHDAHDALTSILDLIFTSAREDNFRSTNTTEGSQRKKKQKHCKQRSTTWTS